MMSAGLHNMFCDLRTATDLEFNVGVSLIVGLPLPRDGGEALKRVREAANQGNAEAQFLLGCDV